MPLTAPIPADEALERLREGNDRFARDIRSPTSFGSKAVRDSLLGAQSPFAIVLACADSRVPAEHVFDCGLGDLFVVRVAGNIVAPSIVGSIEFAAATFGTRLVVVMGHSRCGAVQAAVGARTASASSVSPNIRDIVERIVPALSSLPVDADLDTAVRANVRASVHQLRVGSRVLEERRRSGLLAVVGAEYALETGCVTFFDDAAEQAVEAPED